MQRRDHQARPRRLPRVEDAAHRRAARRHVPPRLLPGNARRRRPGHARHVGRRPRRAALAGLRGQRPGRRRGGRRRVPVGSRVAADAPRVPLPAAPGRPVAFPPVRRASDLPQRGRRRISGRVVLIAVGVVFLLVVVFGRALARFYVDFLWHDGLGRADVFWGVIRAKAHPVRAVLQHVRRARRGQPADRRPPLADALPAQRASRTSSGSTSCSGIACGCSATSVRRCWPCWSPCRRRRSGSRGCCSATASPSVRTDPQFHADVGFYVFELPFLGFVLDWLFVAMVFVLVMTVLTHVLNGGVVFASPVPSVRPATKGHIAVLLAVLAALKAADYWVTRYETTNERRGFVQGATYAVVHAQLPALMLLVLVALLTAGLYLATIRRSSWRLPLIASAAVAGRARRRRLPVPGPRPVARRQPEPAVARAAVHRAQRRGDPRRDGHRLRQRRAH